MTSNLQIPSQGQSMIKLFDSLFQKEPLNSSVNLQCSFERIVPQRPSEITPKCSINKRHRNLSASMIKMPENREETTLSETKVSQTPDLKKSVLLNKSSSKEFLIKPLGSRPGPIRPVVNVRQRGNSQQKPRNANIFESNGFNANPDTKSSKIILFPKNSSFTMEKPADQRKDQSDSSGFSKFLEEAFQKDLKRLEQKSFVSKGFSSLNTSIERDTEENDGIRTNFIITTENSQKPNLKKKRYYKIADTMDSKQFDNVKQISHLQQSASKNNVVASLQLGNIKKGSMSEQASPRNDEDDGNFLDLIKRINQDVRPIVDYKSMFVAEKAKITDAERIGTGAEKGANEKENLRKSRREGLKNMINPTLEKKRLVYMKSIVPIEEEDESTRRSLIPSTGTKDSGNWKNALMREKTDEFHDVLEKLLDSARKSMDEI